MLNINDEQFQRIGLESFVSRIRTILAHRFPADAALIASRDFEVSVVALIDRAEGYGLSDGQSAAIFAVTAWLLGADFDTRYPELQALLQRCDLSSKQKAVALEVFTTHLLQTLERAAGGAA
ncbi:MAG: hypothetical protein IV093_17015 [Rubrivivax sp.]|nr:hypothetical protein [Rubrivivax sp.]